MHRRLAAAQGVVVHGGKVVVHQRIGVDQLDRGGGRIQTVRVRAERSAGGVHQQRTHPLAAEQRGMVHGRVQAAGLGRRVGQGHGDGVVDPLPPPGEQRVQRRRFTHPARCRAGRVLRWPGRLDR